MYIQQLSKVHLQPSTISRILFCNNQPKTLASFSVVKHHEAPLETELQTDKAEDVTRCNFFKNNLRLRQGNTYLNSGQNRNIVNCCMNRQGLHPSLNWQTKQGFHTCSCQRTNKRMEGRMINFLKHIRDIPVESLKNNPRALEGELVDIETLASAMILRHRATAPIDRRTFYKNGLLQFYNMENKDCQKCLDHYTDYKIAPHSNQFTRIERLMNNILDTNDWTKWVKHLKKWKPTWNYHILAIPGTRNIYTFRKGNMLVSQEYMNSLNDDELAFVLSREIVGVVQCHKGEEACLNQFYTHYMVHTANLLSRVRTTEPEEEFVAHLRRMSHATKVHMPHMNIHDYEADELGVKLMKKAGYDPRRGAYDFLEAQMIDGSKRPIGAIHSGTAMPGLDIGSTKGTVQDFEFWFEQLPEWGKKFIEECVYWKSSPPSLEHRLENIELLL